MALSKDEVKHIATLARVGLSEADVERFQHDLSAVLDWFEELKVVDVTGIPLETSLAPERNRSAEDKACDLGQADRILDNVPVKKGRQLQVRSVF